MTSPLRLHSDLSRLGRETDMLLATALSLSDAELLEPSLCEGWNRSMVIAHLIRGGREWVDLMDNVTHSILQQPVSPPAQTDEHLSVLAALPREELLAELQASSDCFSEKALDLAGRQTAEVLAAPRQGINPAELTALRIAEVVVHHHDLDTAWTLEEADPDSLLDALEAVVGALREKGAPGMTLSTEERDRWVIGDGSLHVSSDREGLLLWLARGDDSRVDSPTPSTVLPRW
jgi:maleylpyruvate isomerase